MAETATVLPVINAFKAAHNLTDVTVVSDAGMISQAHQTAPAAAGLSFILGARMPLLAGTPSLRVSPAVCRAA